MVNHSIKKTVLLRIRCSVNKMKKPKLSLGISALYYVVDYQILTLFSGAMYIPSFGWISKAWCIDILQWHIRTVHSWRVWICYLFLIAASLALDLQMVAHTQRSVALAYNHQLGLDFFQIQL
jgi:hypothetical protein